MGSFQVLKMTGSIASTFQSQIGRTISGFFDQRQPSCSTLPDPALFISHNVLS
jgi:hypothetical protein